MTHIAHGANRPMSPTAPISPTGAHHSGSLLPLIDETCCGVAPGSGIALTKKGEAYAAAAARETLTLIVDRTSRKSLATSIEALIDMLDDLAPDPDLEDSADAEPSIGWPGVGRGLAGGEDLHDDRELDIADDEPSLGAPENQSEPSRSPQTPPHSSPRGAQGGWYRGTMALGEDEPTLGAPNCLHSWPGQLTWGGTTPTTAGRDEAEDENEHGGDILDEPHDGEEFEADAGEQDFPGFIWGGQGV